MYICMYVCMYVCVYVCMYVCIYFAIIKDFQNESKTNWSIRDYIIKYLAKREAQSKKYF